jgi:hypothetical protein
MQGLFGITAVEGGDLQEGATRERKRGRGDKEERR